MSVFRSRLETLIPAEELIFDATPGFGVFKRFLGHAIAHPAKMNTKLLEFLIDEFTVEGETVLDPMSGSGSTGAIAALHGRNAVCVELEEKFYTWMEQARKKVESQQTLAKKGRIRNVLGDARKLSTLLKEADVVVTSPPYSEGLGHGRGKSKELQETKRLFLHGAESYGQNPKNIGEIRSHGKVDVVVTSPPYADAVSDEKEGPSVGGKEKKYGRWQKGTAKKHSYTQHGEVCKVDSIITSPPYADSKKGDEDEERLASNLEKHGLTEETRRNRHTPGRLRAIKSMVSGYSKSEENIGNLRFADCIVTSPPYESVETKSDDPKRVERIKKALEKGDRISPRNQNWLRVI